MESLPCELIDLISQWLTLQEMLNLSLTNKYFCLLIQQNHFYLFCNKSFNMNREIYIRNLMQNTNYFSRFYSNHSEKFDCNWIFKLTCMHNKLEIAKWLKEICPQINIRSDNDIILQNVCRFGCLKIAKWIIEICPEIITQIENNINFFHFACEQGHFEIIQWLKEICPKINISSHDDYAFRVVCEDGYFEIAKWLVEIYAETYHSDYIDKIFRFACTHCDNLEFVEWFIKKYPQINVRANEDYAFKCACASGHLQIAKLLKQVCPQIDVRSSNDYAFELACKYGHLETVKWLTTFCLDYILP